MRAPSSRCRASRGVVRRGAEEVASVTVISGGRQDSPTGATRQGSKGPFQWVRTRFCLPLSPHLKDSPGAGLAPVEVYFFGVVQGREVRPDSPLSRGPSPHGPGCLRGSGGGCSFGAGSGQAIIVAGASCTRQLCSPAQAGLSRGVLADGRSVAASSRPVKSDHT